MQLTVKKPSAHPPAHKQPHHRSLVDLKRGEHGELASLDLPHDVAQRLMELGFLPGSRVMAARSAPGGDPRVFRVDGVEIALRRETARHLLLKAHHRSE
jgi:ferrous iron transport protein A